MKESMKKYPNEKRNKKEQRLCNDIVIISKPNVRNEGKKESNNVNENNKL